MTTAPDPAPRPAQRRRTPLTPTCAQPHACPTPVRRRALAQVPFFADLTATELAAVDGRMTALSWGEGDALYRAGDPATHMYVLAAGRAKAVRPTAAGQDVVVDVLGAGDLAGGLTTLGQPVYGETVLALSTTCALRIDAPGFRAVLAAHPQVALRVLDETAQQLAQVRTALTDQSTTTVAQRVAATLLRLAARFGEPRHGTGVLIQLPLTRADLAGMTGSSPESVSRVMSRLRADGVIDSGRRWTAILDAGRLAALR